MGRKGLLFIIIFFNSFCASSPVIRAEVHSFPLVEPQLFTLC